MNYDVRTRAAQKMKLQRKPVILTGDQPDNILGLGKKAKAKREVKKAVRQENKKEKKAVKIEKKKAVVDNIKSKAIARVELAKQGIKQGTAAGDILQGVGGVAGGLLGGLGGNGNAVEAVEVQGDTKAPATQPQIITAPMLEKPMFASETVQEDEESENLPPQNRSNDSTAPAKKNNTVLYLIIAVAAIGFFLIIKKAKK